MESKYDNYGMHKNTFDVLFQDNIDNNMVSKDALYIIQCFTMPLSKYYKEEKNNFNRIKRENFNYVYSDDNIDVKFSMLSDYLSDNYMIQELQTSKRCGHCHNKALQLSYHFNNSQVETGFIQNKNGTFLHSWVTVLYGEDKFIFDYTNNLVMEASAYYNFFNAEKLTEFTPSEFSQYIENLEECPCITDKVFCTFPNEVTHDITKNLGVYKK